MGAKAMGLSTSRWLIALSITNAPIREERCQNFLVIIRRLSFLEPVIGGVMCILTNEVKCVGVS